MAPPAGSVKVPGERIHILAFGRDVGRGPRAARGAVYHNGGDAPWHEPHGPAMSALFRIDEIRQLEARARAGLPAGTLMQRAGESAAQWIQGWLDARRPAAQAGAPADVLVLCGPGDNGGDGFVCATALLARNHRVVCWAPLPSGSDDAGAARARWTRAGGATLGDAAPDGPFDVVVDALLGIGVRRPLGPPLLDALREIEARGWPVIALDIPSGLDADTGAWVGDVRGAAAQHTLTFLADKPGLHTLDGVDAAGTVHVLALGAEAALAQASPAGQLNTPARFRALLAARPRQSNKGDFGSVAIVGGATGMVGAALLAARAALRLGAGKVFVECLGAPELRVDALQPELMFRAEAELPPVDVLVVGCGLGTDAAARARLQRGLEHSGPLVLDADALNCIATDPAAQARMCGRAAPTVLTPHPAEAGRLLGCATRDVQRDRVAAALRIASESKARVVLKGAGSVIAEPGGRYAINGTGGPALASAGTGDVLAGMIAALMAQRPEGGEALLAAVWLHGRGADLFGADIGLTASDVAELAARALASLRRGATRIDDLPDER